MENKGLVLSTVGMPWNRNTLTAEEILGMKQEDFKAKLDGAASKADLEEKLKPLETMQGTLAELQNSLKALTIPKPEPVATPTEEERLGALLSDPQGFVRDQTKGLTAQALETRAQLNEMRARQSDKWSGVFAKYGDDIIKTALTYNAETRAQGNFWDFHLRTYMGDKFAKGEITQENFPSLLGTSSVAPHTGGGHDPYFGVDPQVSAWLKERGVSPEKAGKIKTLMVDHGEPITHANYFGTKAN